MYFEAIWACLPDEKRMEKYGFIRIMTVPGIWLAGDGLNCLSLSCSSGSKDRIGAVCVILQLSAYCIYEPQEIKKYSPPLQGAHNLAAEIQPSR